MMSGVHTKITRRAKEELRAKRGEESVWLLRQDCPGSSMDVGTSRKGH